MGGARFMARHNPNNRRAQFNGAIESKRSKSYRKLHPVTKQPRRKRCTYFSRPLMFDSSRLLDRMFLQVFGICFSQLTIADRFDPMCTQYFMHEDQGMTPDLVTQYMRML